MQAVFLDRYSFSPEANISKPSSITDLKIYSHTTKSEVISRLQDADIAIINKIVIDDAIMAQLPKLKLIQITAAGMDNVDCKAAKQRNIQVNNVAGYAATSVSEHTFMLILTAMRAGIHHHHNVINGQWTKSGEFVINTPSLIDIKGKTLGLIGIGNIAKSVSNLAKAFGMNVLWAEHKGQTPRNDAYTLFEEVLKQSDVIALHCPLTPETKHLINQDTLKLMAKKPLLINVARGAVMNAFDVANALESGQISGLGCDVFDEEPPKADHPLLRLKDHPRLFLTPHNAWVSLSAQEKLWQILCQQVNDFVDAQLKG